MTDKSTPRPWKVTQTFGKLAITRPHKTVGIAFDSICHMDASDDIDPVANAAFIVRAVNEREELLSALRMQVNWRMRDGSPCACPAGENEDEPKGKMPTRHSTACAELRKALSNSEPRP